MDTHATAHNMPATREEIIAEIETIMDPELGVDIWTLGLIYNVRILADDHIDIVMTYTTPMCPFGGEIKASVIESMKALGFTEVDLRVTFDPPWTPPEDLRDMLGI